MNITAYELLGCTFCFALFIRMWKEQWVRLGDLKENLQLWCLCCSYWDRGRGLPPLKRRMEGRRTEGAQVTMLGHDSCRLHCRTQYFTACTIKEIKKTMKTAPGVAYIWITDTYSCQSWCHRLMLLIYNHQNDFFLSTCSNWGSTDRSAVTIPHSSCAGEAFRGSMECRIVVV